MSIKPGPSSADEDWIRRWTIPEEERAKFTSEPWRGGARWFRAPNVVCLEIWRRRKLQEQGKSVTTIP
jgi:hypothetical protein